RRRLVLRAPGGSVVGRTGRRCSGGWTAQLGGKGVAARGALDQFPQQVVGNAQLALALRAIDDFRHNALAELLEASSGRRGWCRWSSGPYPLSTLQLLHPSGRQVPPPG